MDIYHYLPPTNEYMGTGKADPDPLDKGEFLIPAHATTKKPLQPGENQTVVFNNDRWEIVSDYRNVTMWLDHETPWSAENVGEEPPVTATLERPAPPEPAPEEKRDNTAQARQNLYRKVVDPLLNEATIKRAMGDTDAADALLQQAISERQRIQSENPWPE